MADLWSWHNAVDAAGVIISSSTGSAGDLGTSNIRDPRVARVWRAGDMPVTLSIQLSGGAVSVVGLFGVNFSELGIVTVKLGTTAGSGDLFEEELDPSLVSLDRQAVFVLRDGDGALAPVSASYVTIEAATGAPMEIGRVWVGGADWTPTRSHTYDGTGWGYDDLSAVSRTPRSGAYLIDRGERRRRFTAAYRSLAPADYGTSLPLMDREGLARQMLFVPTEGTYDAHEFAVLGYLSEMPSTEWRTLLLAERSITISEAG